MTDTTSPVLKGIDIDKDACLSILRRLIAAQATGEDAVQAVVEKALTGCGASVRRMVYEPSEVPLTGEFAARLESTLASPHHL